MNFFQVKSIQAEHGDALLISYSNSPTRHILVDGGPAQSYTNLINVLDLIRENQPLRLEALVITHYDLDHIGGIIELLKNTPPWLEICDIWFNGFHHARSMDVLGPRDGNILSKLILNRNLPWNNTFNRGAIKVQPGKPIDFPSGMKIWVLSPTEIQLSALSSRWPVGDETNASLAPAPKDLLGRTDKWPPHSFLTYLTSITTRKDNSPSNASSIALMMEFNGRRVLLAGDAQSSVLGDTIRLYWNKKIQIDLLKISHHGSQANTSPDLFNTIACNRFLISTNGKIHSHPDHALIALLLKNSKNSEIVFNYETEKTTNWRNPPLDWPAFKAKYPHDNDVFVDILL
jgi:beta-lactamase superfamily II metal-dependent hydrolase